MEQHPGNLQRGNQRHRPHYRMLAGRGGYYIVPICA